MSDATNPPPVRHADKNTNETVKETLESIVVAFVLAFVFRAYVVEAFVIPTGSMAPTLLGQHIRVTCEECGYTFTADSPERGPSIAQSGISYAYCPMCHYNNALPKRMQSSAGDRILVHKYLYTVTEPVRWDVVVFKNPQKPEENYIKRLVGLPSEQLWIIEGNIYVKPDSPADAPWHIVRKADRAKVQRAVWQPVYHSEYVPLDWNKLNLTRVTPAWEPPWSADGGSGWDLSAGHFYRFTSSGTGMLHFDFTKALRGRPGLYPYDQLNPIYNHDHEMNQDEPIEDVRVAATVVPEAAGLSIRMQTTARLNAPDQSQPSTLIAHIDPQGHATLEAIDPGSPTIRTLASGIVAPLAPGEPRRVEMWYVDQEASLWVDGSKVCVFQYELDNKIILDRPGPDQTPRLLAIEVSGAPVSLHDVEVDRDLFYLSLSPNGRPGRGTVVKIPGRGYEGKPEHLGPNQFFCMGDNSPLSHDGRFWDGINPWIEQNFLPPIFDKDNQQIDQAGIVPRRLLMGRAFFVYFPAPFRLRPDQLGVFPNFGDMRFIH